jgi:hypothetical protein
MRKQSVMLAAAALLVSSGVTSAQKQTPQQYDKSSAPTGLQSTTPDKPPATTLPEVNTPAPETTGAPVPETTGQAPKFEDRWSAQSGVPYVPPTATMPNADAPEMTGQAPNMSKKMGAEMDSAGDPRASPDDQ